MRLKIGYTHKMDVLWAWLILKDKPLDFGVSYNPLLWKPRLFYDNDTDVGKLVEPR